ncbi:hypothetical protein BH10PAT3_BH10PAT3_0870 [soil metagenome]
MPPAGTAIIKIDRYIMNLMVIMLIIAIIIVMLWLAKKGRQARERDKFKVQSASERSRKNAEHQSKQQEIDELITVILPTIRKK